MILSYHRYLKQAHMDIGYIFDVLLKQRRAWFIDILLLWIRGTAPCPIKFIKGGFIKENEEQKGDERHISKVRWAKWQKGLK